MGKQKPTLSEWQTTSFLFKCWTARVTNIILHVYLNLTTWYNVYKVMTNLKLGFSEKHKMSTSSSTVSSLPLQASRSLPRALLLVCGIAFQGGSQTGTIILHWKLYSFPCVKIEGWPFHTGNVFLDSNLYDTNACLCILPSLGSEAEE